MTITFNGLERPSGLIVYNDIPNILKIEDTDAGNKALFVITLKNDLASQTTADNQWVITFLGDTITNVRNYANAVSKNFCVLPSLHSTAASICRAFRNCPSVAANFKVMNSNEKIYFYAREIGPIFANTPNYFVTNIASTYISTSATDGTAQSSLFGSKIEVQLYESDNVEYITSLEKNYYGKEVAFNLSPVLSTISEPGKMTKFHYYIRCISKDGTYSTLTSSSSHYATIGYMVNQGAKYNIAQEKSVLAQNVLRGANRGLSIYNNSLLYVYEPSIPISFFTTSNATQHIDVFYRDSAYNMISSFDFNYTPQTNSVLKETTIPLDETVLRNSFYVDVKFEDTETVIRYNVIKPVKMTEYCQRIYFRNSYGGIAFADMTGQEQISIDTDTMTYQKNIFDYYTSDMNELEKVYNIDATYTYTLKSHLIEKDGKYLFYDMLQSPEVWTIINNEKYLVIVDSIQFNETDKNDIFEATIRFHFSQPTTLL